MSQFLTPEEAARRNGIESARKYLDDGLAKIRQASKGERHDLIASLVGGCANRIASGYLDRSEVERVILSVGLEVGKDAAEVERMLNKILPLGKAQPMTVHLGGGGPTRTVVPWMGRMLQLVPPSGAVPSAQGKSEPTPAGNTVAGIGGRLPTLPLLRHDLRITHFTDLRTTAGEVEFVTWDEMVNRVSEPFDWPAQGKKDLPLWSCCEYEDDNRSRRGGEIDDEGRESQRPCMVHSIHALVLDYDDDPAFSAEVVHEWFDDVQFVMHTSASHMVEKKSGGAHARGRVILALSRAVTEAEYADLGMWALMCGRGRPGKKELTDARRAFFIPARAPQGYAWTSNINGQALDVDRVLEDWRATAAARQIDGPLIVKVPGSNVWYVRTLTGFQSCDQALVRHQLERHWPEVETFIEGKSGPKPLGAPDLYGRYGVRAEKVYYTYNGRSHFDPKGEHSGDLHLSIALEPAPPPVEHDDVLEWLRVLTGKQFETMLDWLATVPVLSAPTAAIVLLGKSSIGKGMFAFGVARYFGVSIADYDDVFKERFNDALLRSPVVFLDEGTKNRGGSNQFRKLLGNRTHAIEAKGHPTATLIGCPRLIVAANNPDPLGLSRENLTDGDEEALGRRLVLVDCDPDTQEWLVIRGGVEFTHDWVTRENGAPGKIPELISWLATNRKVATGDRFLVAGDAGEWASRIGTREGLPATILQAIASYAEDDNLRTLVRNQCAREGRRRPFFRLMHDGAPIVYVSNEGIRENWGTLTSEYRAPTHTAVARALERLSRDKPVRLTFGNSRVRVYPVPATLLDIDRDDLAGWLD